MKAIAFGYKTSEAKIIETDKPTIEEKDDEIMVKVKYSALDTALDAVIQKTWTGGFVHKTTDPLFCGWHFSGTVEATGANVTDFSIGDDVFGHLQYDPGTDQGSCAEYITVKADACAQKPASVSFELAAASATEVLTAFQSIRNEGGLVDNSKDTSKRQSILIVGAGGQVGGAAVQIAKLMGAHVTAVCSTKDVDRVKNKLGADVVIDRKKNPNIMSSFHKEQFDTIFDTPNALPYTKVFQFLKPGGNIVVTLPTWGLLWGFMISFVTSKNIKMIEVKSDKKDLELVSLWLEKSHVQVDIDSTYNVCDIEQAMVRNRDSSKKGRVVVRVENGWNKM